MAARDPLVHRLSPNLSELPLVRRMLREWLERTPSDPDACFDLLVVATELCTNAIQHAGSGLVTLRAWEEDGAVVMEIEGVDRPSGASPIVRDLDDPMAEGGRGMRIVNELCDYLSVTMRGPQRCVQCRRRMGDDSGY